MVEGEHLSAAARGALDLPTAERIERIRRPRWIGYTRAMQLLDKLDDLLTHPKTHRMPNLLIVGDTNAPVVLPLFIEDVENHVLRAWSEFNGFAS
jgi:hypothetical protein